MTATGAGSGVLSGTAFLGGLPLFFLGSAVSFFLLFGAGFADVHDRSPWTGNRGLLSCLRLRHQQPGGGNDVAHVPDGDESPHHQAWLNATSQSGAGPPAPHTAEYVAWLPNLRHQPGCPGTPLTSGRPC